VPETNKRLDKKAVEAINERLSDFEMWFVKNVDNRGMINAERAIVRTYIHWAEISHEDGKTEET